MARIRSIKPEFWVSEQIAECSPSARLTFIGLWNFCDDRGVHPAKPKTLRAELYAMDDVTSQDVAAWVAELIRVGLVREFTADDGEIFWCVTGWDRHQKIDRPSFKHPTPPPVVSTTDRRQISEDSTNARRAPPPGVDRSGVDRSGEEGRSPKSRARSPRQSKTPLSAAFAISDRVRTWAASKGFDCLDQHLEAFRSKALAKGYQYADWDEAFMSAIRDDWARVRGQAAYGAPSVRRPALNADEVLTTGGHA